MLVLDEEALGDSLVHDYEGHRRSLSSVVELVDGLLELRNFLGKADVTLSITQTISVDDEVGWEVLLMLGGKDFDCGLDGVFHLTLDNLLTLLLHQVL